VGTSPRAGVVETRVYVLVDTSPPLQGDHELFMRPEDLPVASLLGTRSHERGLLPGGPRIRHLDDFSWQEVRRQQHGDRTASVREKWLDFSPRFLSLYAEWDPGMIVQPHGHNSDHVVFVVAGEMTCGDVRCPAGTHLALDRGDTFGPFVAGPQGVTLFEVMMGDPRSFPADLDGYERFLAERGVRQLPNPPIDMPEWLEDTRS